MKSFAGLLATLFGISRTLHRKGRSQSLKLMKTFLTVSVFAAIAAITFHAAAQTPPPPPPPPPAAATTPALPPPPGVATSPGAPGAVASPPLAPGVMPSPATRRPWCAGNLTGRTRRNAESGRLRNFERGRFARASAAASETGRSAQSRGDNRTWHCAGCRREVPAHQGGREQAMASRGAAGDATARGRQVMWLHLEVAAGPGLLPQLVAVGAAVAEFERPHER